MSAALRQGIFAATVAQSDNSDSAAFTGPQAGL